MQHIIRPLAARPWRTAELLAASLFIAVFNLASPLFVIQLLNRYVSFGFEGTLLTLTAGMLLAILLLFVFKFVRSLLLQEVFAGEDAITARQVMARVLYTSFQDADKTGNDEGPALLASVQAARSTETVEGVLDAPFSLLYLGAIFLLSPVLGWVALAGLLASFWSNSLSRKRQTDYSRHVAGAEAAERAHTMSGLRAAETVRAFHGREFIRAKWEKVLRTKEDIKQRHALPQAMWRHGAQASLLLTTTVLYVFGAIGVVRGELTVGALIGASILTTRASQTMVRLAQSMAVLHRAGKAQKELEKALEVELEMDRGMRPGHPLNGPVILENLEIRYPRAEEPVLRDLSVTLAPGHLTVFTGGDGAGKTSLARVLAGLMAPSSGRVTAAGVNLRQYAASWWREQLIYLPQDVRFVAGSLLDNILVGNPRLTEREVARLVNDTGLASFLYRSGEGFHLPILDGGASLPFGIRKRLALARGWATDGPFVLLDDPTEGLDAQGKAMIYNMIQLSCKAGKIVAAMSADPVLVQGAWQRVDLSATPGPEVVLNRKTVETGEAS